MKQKLSALGDDFIIKDQDDNDTFLVDGKTFSIGDKLSLLDIRGSGIGF
jgi:uncharacterized protein YxjI